MELTRFLKENKFKSNSPIQGVNFFEKTIGDKFYNVYVESNFIDIYIYDNDDNSSRQKLYFESEAIALIRKVIRQEKIKKIL